LMFLQTVICYIQSFSSLWIRYKRESPSFYACTLCNRLFWSIHARNRHRRESHLAPNCYQCSLYPAKLSRLNNLKRHRNSKHSIIIVLSNHHPNSGDNSTPTVHPETDQLPDLVEDLTAIDQWLNDLDTTQAAPPSDTIICFK
jgi:hypothetical protein